MQLIFHGLRLTGAPADRLCRGVLQKAYQGPCDNLSVVWSLHQGKRGRTVKGCWHQSTRLPWLARGETVAPEPLGFNSWCGKPKPLVHNAEHLIYGLV